MTTKPYHHGDLAAALLGAAAEILERDGLPALTLRAIARAAGVSHMAPAHHFGDLAGLLSELAATGYRRFSAQLCHAQDHPGARTPRRATGQAYVAFARTNPGMFLLMFRSERLDFTRPALAEAATGASRARVRAGAPGGPPPAGGPSPARGRGGGGGCSGAGAGARCAASASCAPGAVMAIFGVFLPSGPA